MAGMSDAIPEGLGSRDARTWAIGRVAEIAAQIERALVTLPNETGDAEIDAAIEVCRAVELRVRRERNLWIHGEAPVDTDSVRGTAQVGRRVLVQIAAIHALIGGGGPRDRLLRRARGADFWVDADGDPHDVEPWG